MTTLSQRALNRALLARQMLLARHDMSALQAIEHLVGMQAQEPNPPYIGLWTRLRRFEPEQLSGLLVDRAVVRVALMRGTIHLVSAADCLMLRPLMQPVFDRDLTNNPTYGRGKLAGLDFTELAATARNLMAEQPRTATQLREMLGARWPDRDPAALAYAVRGLLPLVQVPPRGLWRQGGLPTTAAAQTWLGRELDVDPSPREMIRRYLAAFGPARVRDVQAWSGLTRLGEVVADMDDLMRFDDGLLDLPDAPRPDPDTPAPVRFLPAFDNLLLSHADRTRVISDAARKAMATPNGQVPGAFLVDGIVRGIWRVDNDALKLTAFDRLSTKDKKALEAEGSRLAGFLGKAEVLIPAG
jgi:hypothetical protein